MEYKKQIKKVYTGHFAECNTRQRGALPSVRVTTLDKEHRPGHRLRFFSECYVAGTRQRGRLCRVPHRTIGKEPDMGTLSGGLFAECPKWHSAKMYSLPSAAWKTLGKAVVSVTRRRNGRFSLPSALQHSAKRFAECPRKSTRQRRLYRCTVCRAFFAECDTRQSLYRVFLRLRRVLQALGKAIDSGRDCGTRIKSGYTLYPETEEVYARGRRARHQTGRGLAATHAPPPYVTLCGRSGRGGALVHSFPLLVGLTPSGRETVYLLVRACRGGTQLGWRVAAGHGADLVATGLCCCGGPSKFLVKS
jgi:hypothetical protein